jgi:peptide/nickel transport system permease protein
VFFLVTFGVLILMRLGLNAPGDPARTLLGGTANEDLIRETTEKYHLDDNYFVQYFHFIKGLFTGDFGFSVQNSQNVSTLVKGRVMTTVLLGFYAITLALVIAVPVAVRSAYKRDGAFDRIGSGLSFVLLSVPAIVLAVLLKLILIEKHVIDIPFNYQLSIGGWFPRVGDKVYPWQGFTRHVDNFFLPVITLALPLAAVFTRLLRADMVQTLQADFVTLASAKGVPPRRVLWGHALRNSLFSLVTSVGVQLGALIGGAIVAETFFDLDGMGSMLVVAILGKDLFTVQSVSAILVATVVLVNLGIDLLYAVIDPRIRQARALA